MIMNLEEIQKYLDDHNITFEEWMRKNMITDEERKYLDKIWMDAIYKNLGEDTWRTDTGDALGASLGGMIVSYATKPMDYETHIDIHQYFPDDRFYYKLKVTDVMNMDYYYEGSALTLDNVMECIQLHLKQHQNWNDWYTKTPIPSHQTSRNCRQ